MKDKIVIGRYIERDSWVHRLDPRAKTIAMPLFLLALFMVDSYAKVLAVLAFALVVMLGARIPLLLFAKAVRPLMFLLAFIFLFHLLADTGGARLIDAGPVALYAGGLERGLVAASRMTLLVMFAALLTFTTQPDRLAQGLAGLLRPLQAIGVPTDRFVLMLRTALRFLPTIFEEAQRLWKAQQSRGLSLRGRPMKEKARLVIALLVPVTVAVFRRALALADSMEARGYRIGRPRTAYRQMSWSGTDTLFLLSFIWPLVVVAIL